MTPRRGRPTPMVLLLALLATPLTLMGVSQTSAPLLAAHAAQRCFGGANGLGAHQSAPARPAPRAAALSSGVAAPLSFAQAVPTPPTASAASNAPVLGAGRGGEGWVAIETVWDESTSSWSLYHIPRAADPGVALRVRSIASQPEAMAAYAARLLLVYPPDAGDDQRRSVRGLRSEPVIEGRRYSYTPQGREVVLPSLPGWGSLAGVTLTADGGAALLREVAGDGEARAALLYFDFVQWNEVALPERLDPTHRLALAPINDGFGVVEHRPGGAVVWVADTDGVWSSEPLAVEPDERIVTGANATLVGVRRTDEGAVQLRLLRRDRAAALATIEDAPASFAALGVGEHVVLAWLTPPEQRRLHLEVISSSSGDAIYTGGAQMQSILTSSDIQYLALLMAAVLLMVLIFVLRPSPDAANDVRLPEGVAPATPGRRLLAAVIDLAPVAYLSMRLWDANLYQAIGLAVDVDGAGVMPLLTTLAGVLLLQTITEWRFSWTPGKLLVGCRTVSIEEARRPTLRQALVRNLVKYACPPLTAMIIADPARRHPGDAFAGTVVIAPTPPEQTPPDSTPE